MKPAKPDVPQSELPSAHGQLRPGRAPRCTDPRAVKIHCTVGSPCGTKSCQESRPQLLVARDGSFCVDAYQVSLESQSMVEGAVESRILS